MIKKSILVVAIVILAITIAKMEIAFLIAITMMGAGVIANSKISHGIMMTGMMTLLFVLLPISAYAVVEYFTIAILILVMVLVAAIIARENKIGNDPPQKKGVLH